jgi:FKBP-type peptidyl-prolyl cis-trans isomerase
MSRSTTQLFSWTRATQVRFEVRDAKLGGGPPIVPGCEVVVHYSAAANSQALDVGAFVDSSYERGDGPISAVIGAGELAPGLDDVLVGAREGGTRRIEVFEQGPGGDPRVPRLAIDVFLVAVRASRAAESWELFDALPRRS